MTDIVLRHLHVEWWVPFAFWFGLYVFLAMGYLINGYAQEYLGWRHPGRPGKIHKVLLRFHTGAHIHPEKSFGDEKSIRRTAGGSSRATAEGTIVYFTPRSRGYRAVRNNLIVFVILVLLSCMAIDPAATVRAVTIFIVLLILARISLAVYRKREKIRKLSPVHRPAMAMTARAKTVFSADELTAGATPVLTQEKTPQLEGVPHDVLAGLLASRMSCSKAEISSRLRLSPEKGSLILPDSFAALAKEREPVQELIEAHTIGKVRFSWATTVTPRTLTWVPIVEHSLPDRVRFRDYVPAMRALAPREFGVGVVADRTMYVSNHNGDAPWHCRFANSGTGKSMGFLVKAAQICHNDPEAELYCVDTKQVSFTHLKGIPRVYVFDNPQSDMEAIWRVPHTLAGIMRDRYAAIREGRMSERDFHDIWLLVDEGNDLGACYKSYWKNVLGETSASPSIWGECVGPLLRQGRQARIFGEWMFQDLRDQAMGGESLKMAFAVFGAAGFLPGQFARTVGNPAAECIEGPGKILMCRGNKRTWVQGFYDDEDWLREYALENRR